MTTIDYAYDDAGRMTTATLPSGTGIVTTYTCDDADRLTDISHVKGGSTTIASVAYTLDDIGNRTQRVDQQGTHTYQYDDLYRLTSVVYPGPSTTSYAFDAFGNRTSMTVAGNTTTYAYDDNDRITSVTPPSPASVINYTWDDNGDLTARGSDSFSWDYEDRMASATVNSVTTTFAYRGDGLRDSRSVSGGASTTFTWDIAGGLPVVLDDGNQYVYGAGLTAQKQGGSWYYYLADGLGSTMAVVNASGVVQDSYTYDVYGTPTKTGSLANEFDFAGQQTDGTGLQYLRARYYDPATGTFLSRDLLENKGGSGHPAYSYTSARPVNFADPTGFLPGPPEASWCAPRPWWWTRCASAGAWAKFADTLTKLVFGEESDRSDAFRHCVWSACLTIDLGARDAKRLTNLHEHFDPSGNRQEQRKDLWNNKRGREIGEAAALIGEYPYVTAILECLREVDSGGLIIDPNTAPYYPGEDKILPGPSGPGGGSW